MYKHKDRCKECKYGFLPEGMDRFFEGKPACLYYHDTAKHRDGDDDTCNSFEQLTKEEKARRMKEGRLNYEKGSRVVYY